MIPAPSSPPPSSPKDLKPVTSSTAKFSIGDIIQHRLFEYRGVIVDVDPHFLGTEDWYRKMANSKPPRDRPWYHVLVDGQAHQTYVAERNLEADEQGTPIQHDDLFDYFEALGEDRYIPRRRDS